ncbi:cytochrome P450 6B5-like [Hyposmocoma kahamanoa]|uniref:cytochrome P450 6B5-like n=1 Tax=Hyposmocoma kahamanoa TaxID=1477025 RepID=UPI000E6D871F|nr:cytochrome P450 6B5-like [Hyposmocoma kahamanoa]
MFMLYVTLVLLVVICILYLFSIRTFNYWKNKNVAGPKPVPLFGNIAQTAFREKYMGEDIKEIYEQFPNEKIVGFYRMTSPALLIRDLDIVKAIMIKDFDLFIDRGMEFGKDGLGVNMFHADGETWKVLRSTFSPIFSTGKLKNITYLISEYADKHVHYIEQLHSEPPEMKVVPLTRNYTIATVMATAFGLDLDINDNVYKKLADIDKLMFSTNFVLELDMLFPGLIKTLETYVLPKKIQIFFEDLVSTVIKQRNGEPTDRNDFMDLILAMRKEGEISKTRGDNTISLTITNNLIAAQAFFFYFGGYETSGTTTAFLLYELSVNPDVQSKVIAEIDEMLEKMNGKVTYDSLMGMSYLGRVFDETLRMHPVVESFAVQRNALREYKIPDTDVTIPKGMLVCVSPSGIHYDEKYYPNPYVFDPDRFLPENANNRHSCAYLAFGVGPRNCVGQRLGKLQVLMYVVKLLSKFRLEPSDNTPSSAKNMKYNARRLLRGPPEDLSLRFVNRN